MLHAASLLECTATHTPDPLAMHTLPHAAHQVLTFWFGDDPLRDWPEPHRGDLWFKGGAEVDAHIRTQFGPLVDEAMAGGLRDWEATPMARLALILLLDQFSRNVYRGQARAFAGDARAQALTQHTLDAGEDNTLPRAGRLFVYMPLMHAETLAQQDACVACFERLLAGAPEALKDILADNLRYAVLHRDIVARFGRFPHRNAVLGRESTAAEIEFLKDGPRFGQ
jgi:uncharacterized protein (DUF924 family)